MNERTSSCLEVEEERGVVTLRLHRPEVRNAFDDSMMTALDGAVAALASREDLVAVVLSASGGKAFCAGGDLRWLERFDTPEKGAEMSRRMQGILHRLSLLPAPVIGVINGYALGGGTEVALACDLRIVEEHAYFSFKQARVGVMSGWGGGVRLLHLVGYPRALELFATCRKVHPEEARSLGLANRIVPTGSGEAAANELADSFREGSRRSIRTIKRLLQGAAILSPEAGAALESRLFSEVWRSPEHSAAVEAFLGK